MANTDHIIENIHKYANPPIQSKYKYLSNIENVVNVLDKWDIDFTHQLEYSVLSFSKIDSTKYDKFGYHILGIQVCKTTYFHRHIQDILKMRLPDHYYVLPDRYYKYADHTNYDTCIYKISQGFPILIRQVILDVISNRNLRYDGKYEYIIYNNLLNFDFNSFASNFRSLISKIKVPNFRISDLDKILERKAPILRSLNIIDESLVNNIVKLHMQEWELYFYSSITMYYLNKFNIEINRNSITEFINLKKYSDQSLNSSKYKNLIVRILQKYYKNKYHGVQYAFQYKNMPFGLIDFSEVSNFNLHEFNNYENNRMGVRVLERTFENDPISFNINFDFLKPIAEYFDIKELETSARGEFNTWARMDGHKFEHEILRFFNKYLGLDGEVTRGSGDNGIDIIINNNVAIQCKNHSKRISPGAVRDFLGGCKDQGYNKMIFVSTNGYSDESKRLAFNNGIKLLNIHTVVDVVHGRTSKNELLRYLAIN